MVSLTEPLISFAAPAIRSLSMTTYSYDGHKFRSSRRPYRHGASCGRLGKYLASLPPPSKIVVGRIRGLVSSYSAPTCAGGKFSHQTLLEEDMDLILIVL